MADDYGLTFAPILVENLSTVFERLFRETTTDSCAHREALHESGGE
jgi:hypothetical protein